MEEILHQSVGGLSHYLQGLCIPGGAGFLPLTVIHPQGTVAYHIDGTQGWQVPEHGMFNHTDGDLTCVRLGSLGKTSQVFGGGWADVLWKGKNGMNNIDNRHKWHQVIHTCGILASHMRCSNKQNNFFMEGTATTDCLTLPSIRIRGLVPFFDMME